MKNTPRVKYFQKCGGVGLTGLCDNHLCNRREQNAIGDIAFWDIHRAWFSSHQFSYIFLPGVPFIGYLTMAVTTFNPFVGAANHIWKKFSVQVNILSLHHCFSSQFIINEGHFSVKRLHHFKINWFIQGEEGSPTLSVKFLKRIDAGIDKEVKIYCSGNG